MKYSTMRVISFSLATLLAVVGFVASISAQGFSIHYGESDSLGSSGVLGGSGGTQAVGFSPAALTSGEIKVSTFSQLQNAIQKATGPVYIILENNITLTAAINAKYDVTIDGQDKYTISNRGSIVEVLRPAKGTTLTLYRVALKAEQGSGSIISLSNKNVTVVFEEMSTASGYLAGGGSYAYNSTVIFRNTHLTWSSYASQGLAHYVSHIIFEGESNSIKAQIASSSVTENLFSSIGGTGAEILITNGTEVEIITNKNMFFNLHKETVNLTIEDEAKLYISSRSFVGQWGFKNITVGEGATFSYTQSIQNNNSGKTASITAKNMTLKEDSVFIAHTLETLSVLQGVGISGTMKMDSPKYVSLYSPGGAYNSSYLTNSRWELNNIDYIHYWQKNGNTSITNAHPDKDETAFRPDYSWTTLHLGRRFSIVATGKKGVISSTEPTGMPNMALYSDLVGTLEDTMKFDNENAQRLVIGVPIDIDLPLPETLEMVSVPQTIDFGTHDLPTRTTTYSREDCDSVDENGNMLVHIRDTRRTDTTPWSLNVELAKVFTNNLGETIDGKPLVFVHNGESKTLDEDGLRLYSSNVAADQIDHTLTWSEDEGLLMQLKSGDAKTGDYSAAIKWSLQITP